MYSCVLTTSIMGENMSGGDRLYIYYDFTSKEFIISNDYIAEYFKYVRTSAEVSDLVSSFNARFFITALPIFSCCSGVEVRKCGCVSTFIGFYSESYYIILRIPYIVGADVRLLDFSYWGVHVWSEGEYTYLCVSIMSVGVVAFFDSSELQKEILSHMVYRICNNGKIYSSLEGEKDV